MSKKPVANLWSSIVILIGGLIGLLASFMLILDQLKIAADPDAVLVCSINSVLNCSTVMQTWQAELFGFPNMIIGLAAFPVMITYAVASLMGAKFPKLFTRLLFFAALGGLAFAYWMFFDSLYIIQVLCPWCLSVTFAMTIIFAAVEHRAVMEGVLGLPKEVSKTAQKLYAQKYDVMVTIAWLALLASLVIIKFGASLYM